MAEAFVNVTEGAGKKLHAWDRAVGANTVLDEFTLPGEYPLACYGVTADGISAATLNDHVLQIMAGASLPLRVRMLIIEEAAVGGAAGTVGFDIVRLTTAGTGGTALTPAKLDNADGAAAFTAMTLPTVKGTEGTRPGPRIRIPVVAAQPTNAAGMFTWPPQGYPPNYKSIVIPAGTANGIALKAIGNVATATWDVYALVMESTTP